MQTKLLSVLSVLSVLVTGVALADEFKPAVIYDIGGKFDKSFNESVWDGVQKFTGETGVEVKEFQITNETQRQQAMRGLVERGATMVIAVGFSQADAIDAVAGEYPDRQFAIIDVSWLDRPNLRQYVFKEHEGSYLVGIAAALASPDREGRFCRRNGYSPDPQVPLRVFPGRESCRRRIGCLSCDDRNHVRRMERPDQSRGTGAGPDRPRCRCHLSRCR